MLNQPLPLQVIGLTLPATRHPPGGGPLSVWARAAGGAAGLELEIRRGERVGLIGTGSGKSTTVDLYGSFGLSDGRFL